MENKRNVLTVIVYDGNAVVNVVIENAPDLIDDEFEAYWLSVIEELGISGENYEWHVTTSENYVELRYEDFEGLRMDMRDIAKCA